MRGDLDIQHEVLEELEWEASLDATGIGVAVREGAVTLTGSVDDLASRHAAERAAKRIAEALRRSSAVDARDVTVNTCDHTVILEGRVPTMRAGEEVERLAWTSPGVSRVESRKVVEPCHG